LFANDAYSHYHSLQTTLSRRWARGYFQGAYTWSKSTDATSSGNTALNTAFNDESDLKFSRGLSDFDRTHRLVVSYRYDLPFFSGSVDRCCRWRGRNRHHLWQSRPQHLSWSVPTELGLLADQEFLDHRASEPAFHDGLLQHLEPREFRQSRDQRR